MKTDFSIWVHGPEFGSSMIQVPILQNVWKHKPKTRIDLNVVRTNEPIFQYYFSNKIKSKLCSIEQIKLVHQLAYTKSMDLNIPLTIDHITKNILTKSPSLIKKFKEQVYKKEVSLLVSAGLVEPGIIPKFLKEKSPKKLYIFNYLLEYFNFVKSKKTSAIIRRYFLKHYNNFDKTIIQTFFPEKNYRLKKEVKNLELIPIIARGMTKEKNKLKKELGVQKNEKLIFLSLGGAEFFKRLIDAAMFISKEHPSLKFLLLPRKKEEVLKFEGYPNFIIPKELSFDTQNYVGISDIVITKCGFGTIAEAIKNKTNIISINLPNHAEVTETENILKKGGIIKNSINLEGKDRETLKNELYKKIINEIGNKESLNMMKEIRTDGAEKAAKIYLKNSE